MNGRSHRGGVIAMPERILRVALALALVLTTSGLTFAAPATAYAAPILSVSQSVSAPLLGGKATVSVTVTNNGDAKGYNLSLVDILSSNKTDPAGRVTLSSSDVAATTLSTNSTTGDTTVAFDDIVDLAPTESHTFKFVVDLSGDPSWEVGDLLKADVSAKVNTIPDNSGSWITGAASAQAAVTPILLVEKTANQSTGVHQATGTSTRGYSYTIKVQNNFTNPSSSVVVTDTIPDGVEFLGQTSGPLLDSGYPSRDPATGITLLRWTLGTMAAGDAVTIKYDAGIRYDYFGTAHGGTNRPTDDFSSAPATAAIIPNKTDFTNTVGLGSLYKGSLPATISPTSSDSASVTGAYATIAKSANKSTVGYDTNVTFTLTRTTSEYYTSDNATMTDTLPDGLTYVAGSASLAPDSVTHDPSTGKTVIVWRPATMGLVGTTGSQTITFHATVDHTWEQTAYSGQPIRSDDGMTNTATMSGDWHDQIKPPRSGNDAVVANVSAGLNTGIPDIDKEVWNPSTATWGEASTATIGDTLTYRVRFNTHDGATPIRTDITMGHIDVTDWLPPGTVYNNDAVVHYSNASDFSAVGSQTTNINVPNVVTAGTLSGRDWFLGDVSANGWWEAVFTVTVTDTPVVAEGLKTGNHWKVTGINTFGQQYSDRAICTLDYHEPSLTLTKDTTVVPNPLVPGSAVTYSVKVKNVGFAAAKNVSIVDTLPVGMRAVAPLVGSVDLDGVPLVLNTDYKTAYNSGTGVLTVDLEDTATPAVHTAIPAGSTLAILYMSDVDSGVGAGATLVDTASVGYNTQADGSGRVTSVTNNVADPNTDNESVTLAPLTITKTVPAGPFTVGDSWTDTITVTVPAGMIAYTPSIYDLAAKDGIYVVPGSSAIVGLSGTPPVPAALTGAGNPVRSLTTANSQTGLTWSLASPIDNTGQASDYVFALKFTVQYTGVGDTGNVELFTPTANDVVTNTSAQVLWTTPLTPLSAQTAAAASTNIDQPLITNVKTITSTGPYAGGSTVAYRAVITNTGWARAYSLNWRDVLPTYENAPTLTSVTRNGVDISGSVTPNFSGTPTVTIDFGGVSLGTTDTIQIDYTVAIDGNVPAKSTLTNHTDTDWSSIAGTPAGSRRYNDAAWEAAWTADSSTASIVIAAPTIVKSIVTGDPARVGDTVTYRLRVTVPTETVLPSGSVIDTVSADGFTYVPGTAVATLVSGSPENAAVVSAATFSDVLNPGSTTRFDFASMIDNSSPLAVVGDTPYVFDITYDMVYDGITDAGGKTFFLPAANNTTSNTARLFWSISGVPTSTPSGAVTTNIDQPLIKTVKTITSSGPYAGGSTVGYRVVLTNTGWARAYDLSWEDILPAYESTPTLVSVTKGAADISGSVTSTFSSTPTLTMDFGGVSLGTTETIQIDYTVKIDYNVPAKATLANRTDTDWTSYPGANANERVYDDSAWEAAYTTDTTTTSMTLAAPTIVKSIVSGDPARVGDTVTYRLRVTVPTETVLPSGSVIDTVSADGFTYVPGTAVATLLSGSPENAALVSTATFSDVLNPGSTTRFDFASMIDNSSPLAVVGDTPYVFDITYDMVYDGITDAGGKTFFLPAANNTTSNTARLFWSISGVPTSTPSGAVTTNIDQPLLALDKTEVSTGPYQGGQTVTYQTVITNTGWARAYDLTWQDVLPQYLDTATLVSVTKGAADISGSVTSTFSSTPTLTIDFGGVSLGTTESITVRYTAVVVPTVGSGAVLRNVADVDWTSYPGANSNERVYDDSAWESAYGADTDTQTINIAATALSKIVSAGDSTPTIGEVYDYAVSFSVPPETTSFNTHLTDTVPDGLTVISATPSVGLGTVTVGAEVGGRTPVSWNIGDVANPPVSSVTLTVKVRVDKTYNGGAQILAGASIVNTAGIAWEDKASGGTTHTAGATATVTVVEPTLTLAKAASVATAAPGQDVTYTVTMTNTGTSSAYDTTWQDTLPAGLVNPTLIDVKRNGSSMTPVTDYTAVFSGNPVTITFPGPIDSGDTVTVQYKATLSGGVARGVPLVNTARINAWTSLPGVDPNERTYGPVSKNATVTALAPVLSITKSVIGDAQLQAGNEAHYHVVITNTGDAPAYSVTVTDTPKAGLTYVPGTTLASWSGGGTSAADPTALGGSYTWTFGGAAYIAPGQTLALDYHTLVGVSAAMGSAVNTATAGYTDGGSTPRTPVTATATVLLTRPHVTIDKQLGAGQDSHVQVGQLVNYAFVIHNDGTTALNTVPLADTFSGAYLTFVSAAPSQNSTSAGLVSWTDVTGVGSLAAGATTTVTATFRVIAQPAALSADDTGTITGAIDQYGDGAPTVADTATVGITSPSVSVVKSRAAGTPATLRIGEHAWFDLVVRNTGDTTLTTVPMADTYDSTKLGYIGAVMAPTTASAGSIAWADVTGVGSLAPGEVTTVTVEFVATAATTLTTNLASIAASTVADVFGDSTAASSDDATVTIVAPTLTLSKSASAATVDPGDVVTYTVTFSNTGNGPAYDVAFADRIPNQLYAAGTSPQLLSVLRNGTPMIAGLDYTADMASSATATILFPGPIAAGDSVVVTYRVRLAGGVAAGTSLTNAAVISEYSSMPGVTPGEHTYGPLNASTTVVTHAPALSIVKSVIGDTQLQAGDAAHYRVVVTNNGDAPAYSVAVTDTPAAGLTYVPSTTSASWSSGGTSVADPTALGASYTWGFGGAAYIAPGQTLTLDYHTLVGASAPLGVAENTAEARATDGGGAPVAPVSDVADVLVTLPRVGLSKHLAAGQDAHIQVGDLVTFDYVVHNSGSTAVAHLPLDESYDAAYLAVVAASPAADTTLTGSLHWNDLTGAGSLAADNDTTVTVTFRAIAHPPLSLTSDTAMISGAVDEYSDPVPTVADAASVGITGPSVSVTKTRSAGTPAVLRIGEHGSFDLVIRNTGDTTLTTVPLTDTYDASRLGYVGAVMAPTTASSGSLAWADVTGADSLAPGDAVTVTVEFVATEATALTTNLASIAAHTVVDMYGDSTAAASDDATVAIVQPSLTLAKSASVETVDPGEVVTYTVTFDNTGNGPAYDVALSDRIPNEFYAPGTSPELLSVLRNGSPMLPGLDYTADFASSATATILFPGPIAAGDSVVVTYRVRLAGGIASGTELTNAARISEYSSMPGVSPDERTYGPLDAATSVVTHAPAITLTKRIEGDTQVQAGGAITYVVTVTNNGDAPAYSVAVTDTPAAGLTYIAGSSSASWSGGGSSLADPSASGSSLTWGFGSGAWIAPQSTLTLHYRAAVGQDAPLGTALNEAVGGMNDGGGSPRPQASDEATALVTKPEVSIRKSPVAGQDPFVQVGDTVAFDIVVTNTGSTALDLVPLHDAYDPALLQVIQTAPNADSDAGGLLQWTDLTGDGSLAVGESATTTVEYRVIALPSSGMATDTATVVGAIDQYQDSAPDVHADAAVPVTRPGVTVTKHLAEGQPVPVALGGDVRFVVTVTNSGNTTLTSVPLADTYDADALAFSAATPTPDTTGTGTLAWNDLCSTFGPIAPGAHVTVLVDFTASGAVAAGRNVASIATSTAVDTNGDVTPGSASTATIDTYDPARVTLTKTSNPASGTVVIPGQTITYSITFVNGNPVTFPSALVTDTLSGAVDYIPGSLAIMRGGSVTSLTDDPADADAAGYDAPSRTVSVGLGDLAANATGTVTFSVRVGALANSHAGVVNAATLSSGGRVVAVTSPVYHPVDPFDFIKTATDVNGGTLAAGDQILWTITVTNTSLEPMTGMVVNDTVPDHTTYVAGSITGLGADASALPHLTWNIGDMQVGQVVVLTFRTRVKAGIPRGTTIRNSASGQSAQSLAKRSSVPEAPQGGDPTLLRTGFDERPWLALALALMLAGAFALIMSRRKTRRAGHASSR